MFKHTPPTSYIYHQSVELCSQFREVLQIVQIVYMSYAVVLHIEMREVGGKAEVANVSDVIIIQVKNGEVCTH